MFTGTIDFYRRYRPGIPDSVADVLDNATPAGTPRRLLDIGTGTGLVVQELLDRFDDIIAIDNDADMLRAADTALRPDLPHGTTLTLHAITAEAFTPAAGWRADLVTMCRAFHWLDQHAVLQQLEDQVAPDGAVALVGDTSLWGIDTPWTNTVREVIQHFLGEQRRASSGIFTHHHRPYSDLLAESLFDQVEQITVPVTRTWTTQSILGYLYSTSYAAPSLFGNRLAEFEHAGL